MSDAPVLRLLELVRTKLGAADARLEIGGEPPRDPRALSVDAGPHRRIVLEFAEPPADREALRHDLEQLVAAFHETAAATPTSLRPSIPPTETRAAIDAELAALCVSANARCAFVIDSSSPVVWGRSHEAVPSSVEPLLEIGAAVDEDALAEALASSSPSGMAGAIRDGEMAARLRRRLEELAGEGDPGVLLLSARAGYHARALAEREPSTVPSLHAVAGQSAGYPWTAHGLAGVYLLVLAFDEGFSELHAERAIRGNKSRLERLISALPPIDPPPGKARVVRLNPR